MLESNARRSAPRPTATLERRQRWEQGRRRRLVVTDALIVASASTVGLVVPALMSGSPEIHILYAIVLMLLWMGFLTFMRSHSIEVLGSGLAEYQRVLHASGLAFGFFAATGILLEWTDVRVMLFLVGPLAVLGILVSRWLWRRWLHRQRMRGLYLSRTLVVGTETDVRYVIDALNMNGENGFHVIGATLFDAPAASTIALGEQTIPVSGTIETVAVTAEQLGADRIVVASLPADQYDFVKRLSWQLEGTASELVLSHRITDVVGPRISFHPLDGLPLLQIRIPHYEGGKHLIKRLLDLVVSTLALIPIACIIPILACAIKLDSPGPILYRQERLGRDGQRFSMLKFRTMRLGADTELPALRALNEGAGPLFKLREDPRVTRVGRILRRYSLDELPQFWNVFVGDMSVVGPRPPLPSEAQTYNSVETRRLYIKPGITGLWQVSGRSDLSWDESVRLDLRYVENWSLLQDLQIMWRTAKVMTGQKGAY